MGPATQVGSLVGGGGDDDCYIEMEPADGSRHFTLHLPSMALEEHWRVVDLSWWARDGGGGEGGAVRPLKAALDASTISVQSAYCA
jgi:hypothetical protein